MRCSVAETRRRLHAVGEHVPLAFRVPTEVGRRQQQRLRVVGARAGEGARVARVPEHDRGREDAVAQEVLRTVQVGEQRVEQLGPLREPDLEP
jgi:hypothetical protein